MVLEEEEDVHGSFFINIISIVFPKGSLYHESSLVQTWLNYGHLRNKLYSSIHSPQ